MALNHNLRTADQHLIFQRQYQTYGGGYVYNIHRFNILQH